RRIGCITAAYRESVRCNVNRSSRCRRYCCSARHYPAGEILDRILLPDYSRSAHFSGILKGIPEIFIADNLRILRVAYWRNPNWASHAVTPKDHVFSKAIYNSFLPARELLAGRCRRRGIRNEWDINFGRRPNLIG